MDIGDIAYARGHASLWEYFMEFIQPLASKLPFMVGIGNHEYDWCVTS
jgi:acid phosphatase type 7